MYGFPTAPPGLFMNDGNKPVAHGYGINRGDPLADGILAYWPMWEASGSGAGDVANGHDVSLVNAPEWPTSDKGPILQFTRASSQYADAGVVPALNLQGEMSIVLSFRARGDYTSNQALVVSSTTAAAANFALTFGFASNKLEFWNNAAGGVLASTASISDDEERHIVVVRRGTAGAWTIEIYINGVLDNSGGTAVNPNDNAATSLLRIGRFATLGTWYLEGDLGQVSLYDRPLSAGEAADLSNDEFRLITPVSQTPFVVEAPAGHPTMRRWRNVPYMTPGPFVHSRV